MASPRSDRHSSLSRRDPVAIVGIGCRLPGASDVAELWSLLDDGVDAVGEYPGGRLPFIDAVYAGAYPGAAVATRAGGFLADIDKFDAGFFGISSREAAFIDPQHRLLFETAWEAIEDAGIPKEQLRGTRTGVFAGLWSSDYETCVREGAPETDFYSTVGTGRYSLSGRLSYLFDLRGPSITIDAACSSSLAAIHMACRSIQAGDSELALAGGANVILRPEITLAYSAAGMLSRDGRCRFGDADASGYVRSEGGAVVVLKPLARALADGDRIYAVIRGGAVNSDGNSSGLLISPSRVAQTDLIRTALADSELLASSIEYVEAHGPGTPAGDPVEIEAIGRALGGDGRDRPVLVGSIKTNIGHTEAAAGVAGLIKTALALHRGKIPRSLHYRTPSPRIAWDSTPVKIASEATSWNGDGPHFAAVSSFGITGTNACVILESALAETEAEAPQPSVHLLAISAHTKEGLDVAARRWEAFVRETPEALTNVCYSAARRRTHQDYRLAAAGADGRSIAEALGAWAGGDQTEGVVSGSVQQARDWKLAFVFSGVGGQRPGMCTSLLRNSPVFRESLLECAEAVQRNGGPNVLAEIEAAAETSRLAAAEIVQPAIWAVQLATVKLLESLGFQPRAVVGHSMGEVTAAVACGVLSLDDGAAVICHRSRVSKRVSRPGRMALVGVGAEIVADLLAPYENRIWLAGLNGSESTVLSGDADAIEEILADLNHREIFCRQINSDVASHSPHMEEVRPELEAALTRLSPQQTAIEFYSTSTGRIEDGSTLDAGYWGKNLRQPVLFWPALRQMLAAGCNAFVEIGPHPVLLHSLQETIREENAEAVAVASLRRDSDEYTQILMAFATLHNAGYPVDFGRVYPGGRCVSLPSYPWQRERHWIETCEHRVHAEGVADHVFDLQWEEVTAPEASESGPRHVAVIGRAPIGEKLAAELRVSCEVTLADDEAALEDLLQGGAITDVVHLASVDVSRQNELDLRALWDAQRLGAESLIRTVQLLAANGADSPPRLWILTAGTLPFGMPEGRLRIEHSTIGGFAGAIRREHPELQCRHVDLSESASAEEIRAAAQLFLRGTAEETAAVRGRRLVAPRYERISNVAAAAALRGDATYLITGGLGGVGMEVAGWMVDRGARHIVLTGRRGPSPEAEARIEKLRDGGAAVRFIAADLSSEAATAELGTSLGDMPPLRGIFHAAAVVEDALLLDVTPEQLLRVLAPKMAGAWNLHRQTLGMPLDFFVLCSSIAVPVSQPGQGVYAAANSFLDAFAAWRRSLGLPATSIQWAVWEDTGLAKEAGTQRSAADYMSRGIRSLRPDLGVRILGGMLRSGCACVLAAPVSWKKFAESYSDQGAAPSVFSSLLPETVKAAAQAAPAQPLADRLRALKPLERLPALQQHLLEHLAAVLRTPASRIDVNKPLGALGLDSLMSLELVSRLSASSGVKLPATAVFNFPTAKALTAEIGRRLNVASNGDVTPAPEVVASASAATKATAPLSEEEAILALMTPLDMSTQ